MQLSDGTCFFIFAVNTLSAIDRCVELEVGPDQTVVASNPLEPGSEVPLLRATPKRRLPQPPARKAKPPPAVPDTLAAKTAFDVGATAKPIGQCDHFLQWC